MKRLTLTTVVALLTLAFASVASAKAPTFSGMQPRVASFDFLVDYSGSMMMQHKGFGEQKFFMAQRAIQRFAERIPELGYTAGLRTFAKVGEVSAQQTFNPDTVYAAAGKLKQTYEVFGRLTPMGDGISYWTQNLYAGIAQPTAVFVVSDGENNRGGDALAAAQAAIAANPGLVFHIISVADTKEGQALLDNIAALRPDRSVSVIAEELITSNAACEKFARDTVYVNGVRDVVRTAHFPLGKDSLTPDSFAILDEAAAILRDSNRMVRLDGNTCDLGSIKLNNDLSIRRVETVKAYLESKGVRPTQIMTGFYGENVPMIDNTAERNRKQNRRVDLNFFY